MRIGVLSDTHIPKAATKLPAKVRKGLKGADIILHAGDLVEASVLEELNKIAPTKAVCGNMDGADLCGKLPRKIVVKASRFRIGLIHGWGHPARLPETISGEFTGVNAIVFGHSHKPMNERMGGVLYFNPGSPTDKVFAEYNSYGIIEVGRDIKGTIIRLD